MGCCWRGAGAAGWTRPQFEVVITGGLLVQAIGAALVMALLAAIVPAAAWPGWIRRPPTEVHDHVHAAVSAPARMPSRRRAALGWLGGGVPVARRNLFQDRRRVLLSTGGVAVALLLVLILGGIFAGAMRQLTGYIDRSGADLIVSQLCAPCT